MLLAFLPGVRASSVLLPLGVIQSLLLIGVMARARRRLSPALAGALASWMLSSASTSLGLAGLDFTSELAPPFELGSLLVSCLDHDLLLLLCPVVLWWDAMVLLVWLLAHALYFVGWSIEHVGAPLGFISACALGVLGAWCILASRKRTQPQPH